MFAIGDMLPLFDRVQGWEITKMIRQTYAPVVRLHGLLGVSQLSTLLHCDLNLIIYVQSKILFVYDPAAIQHIFMQTEIYGPPKWAYA